MSKSKNLVIVESPAKAKTIQKYLGSDFEVESSFGHIRDLPKKNDAIDIANNFEPNYIITPEKKKVVAKREVPYLYDISMLFLLALLGFMASGIQTNQMFHALEKTNLGKHIKFNKKTELAYLSLVSLAVSLAVFLGRYLRWNSWDLIINPLPILKDLFFYLVHPLASPNLYVVGILFFVLSAAAHQIFKTSE